MRQGQPHRFSCSTVTACIILLLASLGSSRALAQETATLRGQVIDEGGQPLAGATVMIPKAQNGANTNSDGVFAISDLKPGTFEVIVSYPLKDTLREEFSLDAGESRTVDLVLTSSISTDVVEVVGNRDDKIDRSKAAPGLNEIDAKDIKLIPSLGAPDLAQYLQVMPGVVFTGDQGGQLFVRGGTPVQNLILFDGAVLYNAFHSIGLFSVFDTDYIQRVDFYSGGFPANYGGRISSVMDIKTRSGNFERYSGRVNADPVMAGAMVEGPLFGKPDSGRANSSFLLSFRHSYLDETSPTLYDHANDTGDGLPFSFTDIFAKLSFGSGSNQFNVFGFRQTDNVTLGFPSNIEWETSGGGLNFMVLPNNTQMILNGSIGFSNYENNLINQDENFPRESSINGFNGRLNFSYILNTVNELSFGLQMLGFNNDLRFTNPVGLVTETSSNNTELATYFLFKKVFREKSVSPQGEVSFFERAVLEPSARLHFYNDQSQAFIEPRLRGKLNFEGFSIQASGGIFSQNLISATSDRDVVQLFQAYLPAPKESLANQQRDDFLQVAQHALLGVEVELAPGIKANLEGWFKNFDQVTNVNRGRLFPEDPRFLAESGQSYGADLNLTYSRNRFYVNVVYGYAKNERDDGTQVYNPVFDRRHNLNVVANWQPGHVIVRTDGGLRTPSWEIAARWALGTGFPFTQTQAFFQDLDFGQNGSSSDLTTQNGNLGFLLDQELNGGRLPDFHRLDLTVKRSWIVSDAFLMELKASVINTYDRNNIFFFDRVRNARADQLPIMPTFGVQMRW